MSQSSPRLATRVQKDNKPVEIRPKPNDQDEASLDPGQTLDWLTLNRHAEELDRNKIKYYEEKIADLKRQRKRGTELNDHLKNIEDKYQQDLRQLEIKKQRRLEQIDADYHEDCEELREKYILAQERLEIAWKELYPAGKRRKAYPNSTKELLDRYDPPEETSDDDESDSDKTNLIQELIDRVNSSDNETDKDRRYRLYRVLTKKNDEDIKDNLGELYHDPDDTPEPADVLQSLFTGSSSPSPRPSRTASPSL